MRESDGKIFGTKDRALTIARISPVRPSMATTAPPYRHVGIRNGLQIVVKLSVGSVSPDGVLLLETADFLANTVDNHASQTIRAIKCRCTLFQGRLFRRYPPVSVWNPRLRSVQDLLHRRSQSRWRANRRAGNDAVNHEHFDYGMSARCDSM